MSAAVAAEIRFRETTHTEIDGTRKPCLDVFVGERYLGQVMEVEHTVDVGDGVIWWETRWWVKPTGKPWFYPTEDGLRMSALAELERAVDRRPPMRVGIPRELVISQLRREQERAGQPVTEPTDA